MITIRPGKGNGAVILLKSRDSTKAQSPEREHLKRAVNLLKSGHSGEHFSVSAALQISFASIKVSAHDSSIRNGKGKNEQQDK